MSQVQPGMTDKISKSERKDDMKEPLIDNVSAMSPPKFVDYSTIAWRVSDSVRGIYVEHYPKGSAAINDYKWYEACIGWSNWWLGFLIVFSFIEVPFWCLQDSAWDFGEVASLTSLFIDSSKLCSDSKYLSSMPLVSPLYAVALEVTGFLVIAQKLRWEQR